MRLLPRVVPLLAATLAIACSEAPRTNVPPPDDQPDVVTETPSDQSAPRDASPPDAPDALTLDVAEDLAAPQDIQRDTLGETSTDASSGDSSSPDARDDAAMDAPGDAPMDTPGDAPMDAFVEVLMDVPGDAPMDVPVEVAPSRCMSDTECTVDRGGPVCDARTGRCVPCTPTRDRCPMGQYCTEANTCSMGCRDDDGCDLGARCVDHVCVMGCSSDARCPMGRSCCAGTCVDTRSDLAHCGACGQRCALPNATATCSAGGCRLEACAPSYANCDGDVRNGCEADLRTDPAHCGRCGAMVTLANATAVCRDGMPAVGSCNAGFADCDGDARNGCETATSSNNDACGACGRVCAPGNRCVAGSCVADCRASGSVPCAMGMVCDFTDGACRPPDTRCVLTGEFAACGTQTCGPGSTCNPRTMRCVPALSCRAITCEEGTSRCWGTDCPCTRPPASCTTLAPSAVPMAFLHGAFGFDIDDGCNLYTATMLSGPDYVRRVTPAGTLTTWTSVTNLNMGEVAVQRRVNIGPGGMTENIAFTYICCASCGCVSSTPQGVGHVQPDRSLPVVVPGVITSGMGPFGIYYLDTGPYGLSVSPLGEFFIGNVRANGDWYRYDTDTRSITAVATLPGRVTASTAFDLDTMLVALEGGSIYLVDRMPGGTVRRVGTLGTDVQSMRRDPFTGRFYASLRSNRVISFAPNLTDLRTEAMVSRGSRLALSPDGWLYILLFGSDSYAEISRIALPTAR